MTASADAQPDGTADGRRMEEAGAPRDHGQTLREGRPETAYAGTLATAETEFRRLTAEWKRETAHLSSPDLIAEHRAYQEIIGMGKYAIPLILHDLGQTKAQWFLALRSIARESPVEPKDRGDVDAMTNAWLDWGRKYRYID